MVAVRCAESDGRSLVDCSRKYKKLLFVMLKNELRQFCRNEALEKLSSITMIITYTFSRIHFPYIYDPTGDAAGMSTPHGSASLCLLIWRTYSLDHLLDIFTRIYFPYMYDPTGDEARLFRLDGYAARQI